MSSEEPKEPGVDMPEEVVAAIVAVLAMMEGEPARAVRVRELWPKPSPWRWRFEAP
ncbi:MAG: hypothetical protein OWU84_14845 [Firmicutes bacterium]|nr:hypothetical protein [Bacillota bacterium]